MRATAPVGPVLADMGEFTCGIGGHNFAVSSLFASTAHYCARYPATGEPEVTLTIQPRQLEEQQALLRQEALAEGMKPRTFTDPFLERTVLQALIADYLRPQGFFLLHGSTLVFEGKAYLFTAKCGTGKSTHTRLWRQVFGEQVTMLNDDKPFLELTETGVTAWGSPWSGKHGLDTNTSAPLAGICILERGPENQIHPIAPEEALPFLKTQAAPEDHIFLERLAEAVPLWHMQCTKDPTAAIVARNAMAHP